MIDNKKLNDMWVSVFGEDNFFNIGKEFGFNNETDKKPNYFKTSDSIRSIAERNSEYSKLCDFIQREIFKRATLGHFNASLDIKELHGLIHNELLEKEYIESAVDELKRNNYKVTYDYSLNGNHKLIIKW